VTRHSKIPTYYHYGDQAVEEQMTELATLYNSAVDEIILLESKLAEAEKNLGNNQSQRLFSKD